MKTLTFGLWLACISMLHAQLNAKSSDCTFGIQGESSPASQISANLPSGLWTGYNQSGEEVSLQFFESGLAHWFTHCRERSEKKARLFNWECQTSQNPEGTDLVLWDWSTGQKMIFEVETDCSSIQLESKNRTRALELSYKAPASERRLNHLKRVIAGGWENTTYPFDYKPQEASQLEEAYLKYRFLPDGRFERQIGNQAKNIKESGSWMIAKDGAHLILTFEDGSVSVGEIKYLEMDEMVLQHLVSCQDATFNTIRKDFYFNRY